MLYKCGIIAESSNLVSHTPTYESHYEGGGTIDTYPPIIFLCPLSATICK